MHVGLIGDFELPIVMTVSVCLFVSKCQPCGKLVTCPGCTFLSVTEKRIQTATILLNFTVCKEYNT